MNKHYTDLGTAFRIWVLTAIVFSTGFSIYLAIIEQNYSISIMLVLLIVSGICSLPAFFILWILLNPISRGEQSVFSKLLYLLLLQFGITLVYGLVGNGLFSGIFFDSSISFFPAALISFGVLFVSSLTANSILLRRLIVFFSEDGNENLSYSQLLNLIFSKPIKNNLKMETTQPTHAPQERSNRILIKGLITGALILLMLIPTIFISNLVDERQSRQQEVVNEVSSKWASPQRLSGPFLVVPYSESFQDVKGKTVTYVKKIILLPDNLDVKGTILPEERTRSIYKVLLYKSDMDFSGIFKPTFPEDIDKTKFDFKEAKLCFTLTDFKGIENEVAISFAGQKLIMNPGLPLEDFGKSGLSVPVTMDVESITKGIPFSMKIQLKGSRYLNFLPLAGNSKFALQSPWADPSFDGDVLPGKRVVNEKGFSAQWDFNRANLPFNLVLKASEFKSSDMAFGVSLVQPSDQYSKTSRSVKYAILFIGLTFSFFFIIELIQKKYFHPLQYVLVGLALVVFYTLLLSFSEYILFIYAYIIAALGTILLITLYVKSHFKSWKTAGIFFSLLTCLYSFIYVLIILEDTALLVGSIGLFTILALAMYVSRKINWYGSRERS